MGGEQNISETFFIREIGLVGDREGQGEEQESQQEKNSEEN